MLRALVERADTLMWAVEGGARAGMGMQRTAFYLQFMLEEIATRPDIVFMAVTTKEGDIVAHSEPSRIGGRLSPSEITADMTPFPGINWRIHRGDDGKPVFVAYRLFTPLPGFRGHMGHGGHGRRDGHEGMMSARRRGGTSSPNAQGSPPAPPADDRPPVSGEAPAPPAFGGAPAPGGDGRFSRPRRQRETAPGELVAVAGLDMSAFDKALNAAQQSTFFTALLVGLLGVGGFISLFWAQSYRLSRRLLLDATAFADEVVGSLPLGLVIFDAAGRVSRVNGAAERLLGRVGPELLGLLPEDVQGGEWRAVALRVRRDEPVLEEEQILDPPAGAEGRAGIPVSLSASRIVNEKGADIGMIFLLRDLREVKRLQAELRRSERLSTLGNMAARVAHEIRNPLSSIKGFATYLGSVQKRPEDAEAARAMIVEVDRLNRVVSELLDFARPSNLNIAPADIGDILGRTIRLADADAAAKGVELRLEIADESPPVPVDAERLTQALLNLALNAVQATDAGGSVTFAALPPEGGRAVITVSDTGRGMDKAVLSQVFSPYFTTRATGTGLGLAIVAKIIEDHSGDIAMRSEPGRGTEVTLRLPLNPAAVAAPPETVHA